MLVYNKGTKTINNKSRYWLRIKSVQDWFDKFTLSLSWILPWSESWHSPRTCRCHGQSRRLTMLCSRTPVIGGYQVTWVNTALWLVNIRSLDLILCSDWPMLSAYLWQSVGLLARRWFVTSVHPWAASHTGSFHLRYILVYLNHPSSDPLKYLNTLKAGIVASINDWFQLK